MGSSGEDLTACFFSNASSVVLVDRLLVALDNPHVGDTLDDSKCSASAEGSLVDWLTKLDRAEVIFEADCGLKLLSDSTFEALSTCFSGSTMRAS